MFLFTGRRALNRGVYNRGGGGGGGYNQNFYGSMGK